MKDDSEQFRQRIAALEREVAALKKTGYPYRGIRKRSHRLYWGLPLYDIALGPDPEKGEMRGHAKGIIAIGDLATGVLALGGLARGVIALGGMAAGLLAFGGLAIGGIALGGGAIGGIAIGGGAIGGIAIGGGAFGYYAAGGGAFGQHVISGMAQDPEAVRFFSDWIPGLRELLPQR